jgi:hypothetical protein
LAIEAAVDAGQRRVVRNQMFALRYLDVIVAVLAAIVAIVLGAPALGCALGAGGWLLQRGVQAVDRRWAQQVNSPRAALGISLFERFGRIWLLAGVIVIAGVAGARKDGLAAALIIFCAYSVRFVISLVSGPPGADTPSASSPSSTTRSES